MRKKKRGRPKGAINQKLHAKKLSVWRKCKNDIEAAEMLGLTRQAIHQWRRYNDIDAKCKVNHKERLKAYRDGSGDSDSARILGIHYDTFRHWRISQGLKKKDHRQNKADALFRKRFQAYKKSKSDGEAAKILSISKHAFTNWRLNHGLKSKIPVGYPKGKRRD